jgi:hypothetical protein
MTASTVLEGPASSSPFTVIGPSGEPLGEFANLTDALEAFNCETAVAICLGDYLVTRKEGAL